jgi:PAS domain S-box-containing protein
MHSFHHGVQDATACRIPAGRQLRLGSFAWVPLPVFLAAEIGLCFVHTEASHESIGLLNALNLLLTTLPSLGVAILFARSFLAAGAMGVGLFGCGALFLSTSGLAALIPAQVPGSDLEINTIVTIHNLTIWAASLCFLAGAALLQRGHFVVGARVAVLLTACILVFAAAALIMLMAVQGAAPVFFVQGQGASPERQLVLISAVLAILLTLLLMRTGVSFHSPFVRWFAMALALLATGYMGVLLQTAFGGVLGWVARGAQYLGGGYMVVAAYAAFRNAGAPLVVQGPPQDSAPHRYSVAVAAVLVSAVIRVVLLSVLQARFTFTTFYPALVLAAVYGGFRAGALATLFAAALMASPWLSAGGVRLLEWPREWPALLVFGINGILISLIAGLMQKAQARVRKMEAGRLAGLELEVARRTEELRESEERRVAALRTGNIGVYDVDLPTGKVKWDRGTYRLWGVPEGTEVTYGTFLSGIHPADLEGVKTAIQEATDPAGSHRLECEYRVVNRADGSVRWVLADGVAAFDGGTPVRLIGVVQDITERKRSQERIHLLMREVNHRSKNMLSIVQSIAHQTIASSPADFLERFIDRVKALAASQDLLIENGWKGVALPRLIRSQLALFENLIGARIELSGPAVVISANAAQTLGMVLHELATNASKYGALSNQRGRIKIEWMLKGASFQMSWNESGGPAVRSPKKRGFGSVIITATPQSSLDATVRLDFAKTGLVWQLECPAHEVIEASTPPAAV